MAPPLALAPPPSPPLPPLALASAMAVAAAVLSLPNLFFGFADAPAAKAMTRARAVVPARIFLNIMTSSPLWGRSPDADARMSRHGNAAQGAVEVARGDVHVGDATEGPRSEEHTSELQSLMRISYAVFCL